MSFKNWNFNTLSFISMKLVHKNKNLKFHLNSIKNGEKTIRDLHFALIFFLLFVLYSNLFRWECLVCLNTEYKKCC